MIIRINQTGFKLEYFPIEAILPRIMNSKIHAKHMLKINFKNIFLELWYIDEFPI